VGRRLRKLLPGTGFRASGAIIEPPQFFGLAP
jgi:hypothetical protein